MRSILRSTLLASFALATTWGLTGCEDTSKPTPPANPPAAPSGPTEPEKKGGMEPEKKGAMEPEKGAPEPTPPK